jgi:uncharacterized protein (TIGR02246 family)
MIAGATRSYRAALVGRIRRHEDGVSIVPSDEEAIREVVHRWQAATRAGDPQSVLNLMTDDVVFVVVGREPFGKSEFAAMSASPLGSPAPAMDIQQRIDEIQVVGEVAYMRSHVHIKVTPPKTAKPIERSGNTLTIFRRIDGRWLLARDANLLIQTNA